MSSAEQILETLKSARQERDAQAARVRLEMQDHSRAGELWSNSQCIAWPEYEASVARLDRLRNEYGT